MKSIIFNQHQVNHALNNKEGMFRVVVKPQPQPNGGKGFHPVFPYETPNGRWNWVLDTGMGTGDPFYAPYQVGETIFVKESFCHDPRKGVNVTYKQELLTHNLPEEFMPSWKPAQHMKQEHSRLTLRIKSVKIEKLQDISEEDCIKEGIGYTGGWNGEDYDDGEYYFGKLTVSEDGMNYKNEMFEYPEDAFAELWNSTHKKPKEKWEANPFVFCFSYEVVR